MIKKSIWILQRIHARLRRYHLALRDRAYQRRKERMRREASFPFLLPPLKGVGNDYSFLFEADAMSTNRTPQGVSVIIPVYNRKEILAKTLAALTHQTYPSQLVEVIVADDGSTDGVEAVIAKYAQHLDIQHVSQEDRGYRLSAVRNLGIRAARFEYIVLLDCDMLPVPGFLEAYMRYNTVMERAALIGQRRFVSTDHLTDDRILADIDVVLNLPDIVPDNDVLNGTDAGRRDRDWRHDIYVNTDMLKNSARPFEVFCGGNVAFARRHAFNVGMFDESFEKWGCEDGEFAYRLYNNGLYFVPVLEAEAMHQEHPLAGTVGSRKNHHEETKKLLTQKVPLMRSASGGGGFEVPKVSIYIPAYNAEAYIKEAIDSVLTQTYEDLEVCICNDGSTDGTLRILEENFSDDPRVRWVSQENGGIGKASNVAVRMCRGAYIGQLDADDRLLPHAVETLVRELDRNPAVGCAYGTYDIIGKNGLFTGPGYNWPFFFREKLLNNMIVHHFRMFRKRDWMRTEGFNEEILNSVDYDMYVKLSEVCEFVHVNEVLYHRRMHGTNTSLVNIHEQTKNTYLVVEGILKRYGLDKEWRIAPNPDNPRDVRFERIGKETEG